MVRQMKDSGIEWIGEIPESWNVCRVKNVANVFTGNSIKDEDKDQYSDEYGARPYISSKDIDAQLNTIDYENGMYTKNEDDTFKVAQKGSTLMCIEGGSAGVKKAFLKREVSFVNKLCCFEPENVDKKYLYYSLMNPCFEDEFQKHISGLIGGVSVSALKNFAFLNPTINEQQKIADFLDAKVTKIDEAIDKTRKTIEEYKALKQSIITKAVTKGVRGDRPMKDSGIEWIGEIPEEWDVNMAFQIFSRVKNKNVGTVETNLLSLSYGNIIRKRIDTVGGLLPENFEGYNIIEKDNIVLRLTDLQNDHKSLRVGLSEERGIITSAYLTLKNESENIPKYLYYYLHSFDIAKGFYGMGAGVRQGLNWDELKHLQILVPSIEEQNEIVECLVEKCAKVDALVKKKEQLITELETYKKSLIYEYVTGKKEVPGYGN